MTMGSKVLPEENDAGWLLQPRLLEEDLSTARSDLSTALSWQSPARCDCPYSRALS